MITTNEAIKTIQKKYPMRRVQAVAEYKGDYLISAPGKTMSMDYSNPYYIVDKKTGKVYPFHPMEDLDGFYEAMTKHSLYNAE